MDARAAARETRHLGEPNSVARSEFYARRRAWWLRMVGCALVLLVMELGIWSAVQEPRELTSWVMILYALAFVPQRWPVFQGPGRPLWWVTGEGLWTARGGGRLVIAAEEIAGVAESGGSVWVSGHAGGEGVFFTPAELASDDTLHLVERIRELVDSRATADSAAAQGPSERDYYRARFRMEPGMIGPLLVLVALIGVQGFVLQWIEDPSGWRPWLWLLPSACLLAAERLWRLRPRKDPQPVLRIDDEGVWLLRGEPSPSLLLAADNVDRVLWGGPKIAVKRRDGTTLHLGLGRLGKGDREDVEARIRVFGGG